MKVVAIGTEIVECLRIARMIERHGELFINRVYTPLEIRYCQSRKHANQHFAGHWAAKEAVLKLLGTNASRGVNRRDIEVRSEVSGKWVVAFRGGARDLVVSQGIREILVTISHSRSVAVAYALAMGEPGSSNGPQ